MAPQHEQHQRTERSLVRVVLYPADLFGCGHFRMIYPAEILRAQGHDVTIVEPGRRDTFTGRYDPEGRCVRVDGIPEGTDVVVLQRVTHRKLAEAVSTIRRQGVAVVIDMDDDLSAIHPDNPAYTGLHPKAGGEFSWQSAKRSCADATMVTASTWPLAQRYAARDGGAVVLDNYVPERYHRIRHTDAAGEVGYPGSLHSHPDDVPQVGFAVERLVSEGHRFRVVGGSSAGFDRALGLPEEPASSGPLHILEWPDGVATLGVGMAPLSDSRFNEAKSRLKVLEMSALGVPWVASPRAEYERFHRETGVGFMARRPRDWYRRLEDLMTNESLRREQSEAGRSATLDQTYEANAWRWMEAWDKARRVQRTAGRGRVSATYPGVR
jgi:hypothetical protein